MLKKKKYIYIYDTPIHREKKRPISLCEVAFYSNIRAPKKAEMTWYLGPWAGVGAVQSAQWQ